MSNLNIKVLDRKGNLLAQIQVASSVTVGDLMKNILKQSEKLSKYPGSIFKN